MIVLNLTPGTTSGTTPVGMTQSINTNSNVKFNNQQLQIVTPGLYEVTGISTITATAAGNTGLTIYANSTRVGSLSFIDATASGDQGTIPIYGVMNIKSSSNDSYVQVTIVPTGNPTIVNGVFSIKKIS